MDQRLSTDNELTMSCGKRKKVLVSAYACNPELGSEPGMGWNWVRRLAHYYDLWVLTEKDRDAPAMRRCIDEKFPELHDKIHIIGIKRKRYGENIWSHFYYWTYMLWQRQAYRVGKLLHTEVHFDLVHQLNMIGYREPGYLWKLGLPMIWGPIGGHIQMPWKYVSWLGNNGRHYFIRNIINAIQMRFGFRVRDAMKKADVLIAATTDDQLAIQSIHNRKSELINATCATPSAQSVARERKMGEPLRIAWCGLLIPRKALPLGLHAIAKLPSYVSVELHIIGSGQCEEEWKQLAIRLGVEKICHWHGHQPLGQVHKILSECDVFLFTSIQDASPTVVMEAIQNGLPVICHDKSGHGTIINKNCGIKIPMITPEVSIEAFTQALTKLYSEEDMLERLSKGAVKRAEDISWENMTARIATIGHELIRKKEMTPQ